jgi:hypothetical protein
MPEWASKRRGKLCNSPRLELSSASVFPYDSTLLAAVAAAPQTVSDVVRMLEEIQAVCADGDGLKWFNLNSEVEPRF